jgi:Kinesin motor domain
MGAAALEETTYSDTTESAANTMCNDPSASAVQVAVRIRPILPHEAGNTQCVDVLKESPTSKISTIVRLGGESGPKFTFDQVFPLTTTQAEVYVHRVAPLVASCLEGYNATILAYGQTGSGYVVINDP